MIDIVIPTCEKDLGTLEIVIKNAKKYINDAGNVYVISKLNYTNNATWVPESMFPFQKEECIASWYYQQLLKLYAYKVIPDLSSSFLILDSETIFYKPIEFINNEGKALYCTSDEKNIIYYEHMIRFLPDLYNYRYGIDPRVSGIVHHMLFQADILDEIFHRVESIHNKPLWRTFLDCVQRPGASEYEIYFCYVFAKHPTRVSIRNLKWDISPIVIEESDDYDFLTAHAHLRRD